MYHTPVSIVALFTVVDRCKQSVSPSASEQTDCVVHKHREVTFIHWKEILPFDIMWID